MRILLTGGSGFLGCHIVAEARARGYEVLTPRSTEFDLVTMKGVQEYMRNLVGGGGQVDVIVHSAAYYGGIGINETEPATIFYRNTQMALNVFELAREHQVRKVLPIGSACAYPGYLQGDLKEAHFWDGKLHDSVEAYGFTKKIQLVAQRAYFKQHGIESNHLVLTNLYGPHDVFTEHRSHVLAAMIKKFTDADDKVVLWGDGSPIREFLYVKDAADAIVRAIELDHDLEPINVGTGVGTSIGELAELVAKLIGFRGEIEWDTSKPGGTHRKVLDVTRMKQKLGWYPRWRLEDGLAETVDWYLKNKEAADLRE
ncbi:MAG: NAD-dependent epimerase/dehydratase family protein [Planctomycetes bacterium]|nr:NAD-dependent epimerase/dehydratase family protein [Planctomycetota bacterium]